MACCSPRGSERPRRRLVALSASRVYSLAQRMFSSASSACSRCNSSRRRRLLFFEAPAHGCFFLVGALDPTIDPGDLLLDAFAVGAKAQEMPAHLHGARRKFRQEATVGRRRRAASNRPTGSPTAAPARVEILAQFLRRLRRPRPLDSFGHRPILGLLGSHAHFALVPFAAARQRSLVGLLRLRRRPRTRRR